MEDAAKKRPQNSRHDPAKPVTIVARVAEGDRALIFTQFARWGHWMQAYLQQMLGRDVLFLHGGTPQKQRDTMVDRFQNDPQSPSIFILSL